MNINNPYTPGQHPRRKRPVGLSAREYTQITGTIASARRGRLHGENDDDDDDGDYRQHALNEPSFIAEASFARAPLNSRIPSTSNVRFKRGAVPSPRPKPKHDDLSVDRMPLEIQEAMVLEDLLYVLMGMQGTLLTFHSDYSPEDDDPLKGIRFVAHHQLDSSIRDLVDRILPLGTYYTAITSFIELKSHLDFGLVNHALCASIRDMLKDYQTLLSQLEHAYNSSPTFSLQKLWFYVHPTIHTLSLIYHLVREINSADDPNPRSRSSSPSSSRGGRRKGKGKADPTSRSRSRSSSASSEPDLEQLARDEALGLGGAGLRAVLSEYSRQSRGLPTAEDDPGIIVKGGEVMTIIYERMINMAGDATANAVYGKLLREAGKPYVKMLVEWVQTGKLVDPYEELLVKESKHVTRGMLHMDYTDEYWEKRYTLRDGSTSSTGPARGRQAGIPPPRARSGHLPGGACVPPMLEPWKHKVLLAGKYLNVIRECGIEIVPWNAHSKIKPRRRTRSRRRPVRSEEDSDSDQLSELSDPELRTKSTASDFQLDDDLLDLSNPSFFTFLSVAYDHANSTLLNLLLNSQGLLPRLRTLKKYFFLSQASFLTHFLDLAGNELKKTVKTVSKGKLQSLLDLAVTASAGGVQGTFPASSSTPTVASTGRHAKAIPLPKDSQNPPIINIALTDMNVYDFLLKIINVEGVTGSTPGLGPSGTRFGTGLDNHVASGGANDDPLAGNGNNPISAKETASSKKRETPFLAIDALTFDTPIPFPLSLVISRKTILRYQLIFRFLLHLKHVEQSLETMWIDQMTLPWRAAARRAVREVVANGSVGGLSPTMRPNTLAADSGRQSRASVGAAASNAPRRVTATTPTSEASSPLTPFSASPSPWLNPLSPNLTRRFKEFENWRLRVCLLRTRMLAFTQQILTFVTFEVVEPNWRKLEVRLGWSGLDGTGGGGAGAGAGAGVGVGTMGGGGGGGFSSRRQSGVGRVGSGPASALSPTTVRNGRLGPGVDTGAGVGETFSGLGAGVGAGAGAGAGAMGGGGVQTVDELLRDHVDFLDTCLKECMLTSSKLVGAYSRLIVTCSTFAVYAPNFGKSASSTMTSLVRSEFPEPGVLAESDEDLDAAMRKRWEFLNKFEMHFNHWLRTHLGYVQYYASSENVSLLPLVMRLSTIKSQAADAGQAGGEA